MVFLLKTNIILDRIRNEELLLVMRFFILVLLLYMCMY